MFRDLANSLAAVKYLGAAKNLSAVTHISESVFIMPSDAETAAQAAANKKRHEEQCQSALDGLMATGVGRSLVQQRAGQLAGAGAAPVPGGSGAAGQPDTTAVLKDLVKVLVDAKAKKPKRKKAAKGKASKRTKSGNTTTDTSSSDSEDGGREDPIPQPLQRPYGKGSYDRETDDLFTQDGELSLKTFKS